MSCTFKELSMEEKERKRKIEFRIADGYLGLKVIT
jgi:hypothetical protein